MLLRGRYQCPRSKVAVPWSSWAQRNFDAISMRNQDDNDKLIRRARFGRHSTSFGIASWGRTKSRGVAQGYFFRTPVQLLFRRRSVVASNDDTARHHYPFLTASKHIDVSNESSFPEEHSLGPSINQIQIVLADFGELNSSLRDDDLHATVFFSQEGSQKNHLCKILYLRAYKASTRRKDVNDKG